MSENAQFCRGCGAKVNEEQDSPQEVAPEPEPVPAPHPPVPRPIPAPPQISSNEKQTPPEGFELDPGSGLYYIVTYAPHPETGELGRWTTWFNSEVGEYQQTFTPDPPVKLPEAQQNAVTAPQAQGQQRAVGEGPTHSVKPAKPPSKKLRPLLALIPAAGLVLGALIAALQFGLLSSGGTPQTPRDRDTDSGREVQSERPGREDNNDTTSPGTSPPPGTASVERTITAGYGHVVGLNSDGTVVAAGNDDLELGILDVSDWRGMIAIAAGQRYTMGLRSDGTVIAIGNSSHFGNANDWSGITAIAAGYQHAVGLRTDGTVIATGSRRDNVSDWSGITAIAAGQSHAAGIRSDRTAVSAVMDQWAQAIDVSGWSDITAIAVGQQHIVGLRSNGTVVVAGFVDAPAVIEGWSGITAIAVGSHHTVGLRSDGTVVATGGSAAVTTDVGGWSGIIAIAAADTDTFGLRSDGSVISTGNHSSHYSDALNWALR